MSDVIVRARRHSEKDNAQWDVRRHPVRHGAPPKLWTAMNVHRAVRPVDTPASPFGHGEEAGVHLSSRVGPGRVGQPSTGQRLGANHIWVSRVAGASSGWERSRRILGLSMRMRFISPPAPMPRIRRPGVLAVFVHWPAQAPPVRRTPHRPPHEPSASARPRSRGDPRIPEPPVGRTPAAVGTNGRGDGLPDLNHARLVGALQHRHEQGVGPERAGAGMVHRWLHSQPPDWLPPCLRRYEKFASAASALRMNSPASYTLWRTPDRRCIDKTDEGLRT